MAVLVLFLFWKEIMATRKDEHIIKMSTIVSESYLQDAQSRAQESDKAMDLVERLLEENREDRRMHEKNVHLFADRFMSFGDLQKFAMLNTQQREDMQPPVSVNDEEEAYQEVINHLMRRHGMNQHEAEQYYATALSGQAVPAASDLMMDQDISITPQDVMQDRADMVRGDIKEAMSHATPGVRTAPIGAPSAEDVAAGAAQG